MEVTVRFSEPLIRKATFRFWMRTIRWDGWVVVVGGVLLLAYLVATGHRTMATGALAAVTGMTVVLFSALYFVRLRGSLSVFRRMASPTVTYVFDEEGLSTRSDLGSSRLSWKGILKVWTFPEVWLLFVAKGQYLTLPIEQFDEPVRRFILDKSKAVGAAISG